MNPIQSGFQIDPGMQSVGTEAQEMAISEFASTEAPSTVLSSSVAVSEGEEAASAAVSSPRAQEAPDQERLERTKASVERWDPGSRELVETVANNLITARLGIIALALENFESDAISIILKKEEESLDAAKEGEKVEENKADIGRQEEVAEQRTANVSAAEEGAEEKTEKIGNIEKNEADARVAIRNQAPSVAASAHTSYAGRRADTPAQPTSSIKPEPWGLMPGTYIG